MCHFERSEKSIAQLFPPGPQPDLEFPLPRLVISEVDAEPIGKKIIGVCPSRCGFPDSGGQPGLGCKRAPFGLLGHLRVRGVLLLFQISVEFRSFLRDFLGLGIVLETRLTLTELLFRCLGEPIGLRSKQPVSGCYEIVQATKSVILASIFGVTHRLGVFNGFTEFLRILGGQLF